MFSLTLFVLLLLRLFPYGLLECQIGFEKDKHIKDCCCKIYSGEIDNELSIKDTIQCKEIEAANIEKYTTYRQEKNHLNIYFDGESFEQDFSSAESEIEACVGFYYNCDGSEELRLSIKDVNNHKPEFLNSKPGHKYVFYEISIIMPHPPNQPLTGNEIVVRDIDFSNRHIKFTTNNDIFKTSTQTDKETWKHHTLILNATDYIKEDMEVTITATDVGDPPLSSEAILFIRNKCLKTPKFEYYHYEGRVVNKNNVELDEKELKLDEDYGPIRNSRILNNSNFLLEYDDDTKSFQIIVNKEWENNQCLIILELEVTFETIPTLAKTLVALKVDRFDHF